MDAYLSRILKAPSALRFIALFGIGAALLIPLVELPGSQLRLEKPAVSISQSSLGLLFLVLAFSIPFWGTYKALRADWSQMLKGKLVASFSYDLDTLCQVVDTIGHPPHWMETPVSSPTDDRNDWLSHKKDALEALDHFFQDEIAGNFTYTKLDAMRTRLVIFLDAKRNPHRWQSYSLSGMGEIQDSLGGTLLQGHVRVDDKHSHNIITIARIRDLISMLRKGIPILLVWDEQLRPLGDVRSYPNYLFFRLHYSILAGRWLLSDGLAYLDTHGASTDVKVVLAYTSDLVLE